MKNPSKRVWQPIFAIMVALTLLIPVRSQASAYGYEYWGESQWFDVWIPKGQLVHAIEGDGLWIEWQGGDYIAAGNLCDASLRFTYGGRDGKWTHYADGAVRWGCSPVRVWKYYFNWYVPAGDSCAELWIKNWAKMVARQCHYVYD